MYVLDFGRYAGVGLEEVVSRGGEGCLGEGEAIWRRSVMIAQVLGE